MGLGIISKPEVRNHRYVKLRGDEISLVTSPAILDEDEIQKGAGIVVMKLEERDRVYPAWVQKLMSKEGEDLRAAMSRLIASCRAMMVAAGHAKSTYDCDPIHVGDDHVLMADHYGEDPFSGNYTATRCDYTQDTAGDFHVGKMTKMRLQMLPEEDVKKMQDMMHDAMSHSDKTMPLHEDMDMPGKDGKKPKPGGDEMTMKAFNGVEVGGTVVKTEVRPGQEFMIGAQVVFKVGDDGAVVPGEGFVHGDDGIVRPQPTAVPVEPLPAATQGDAPGQQAAEKSDDRVLVVTKLIEAGRPFRFTADGNVEVLPEPGSVQKSADDGAVAALTVQVEKLTQQLHGTDGRLNGSPPTYDDKDEQGSPVLIFTDPQRGFFTTGLFPRRAG